MENNRRRKRRNRIWLAILLLGAIIQINLIFNESPSVQSANKILNQIAGEAVSDKNTDEHKDQPTQQPNPATKPASDAPVQTTKPQPHSSDMPVVGHMIAKIPRSKPTVYLTFDDGPGKHTKDIVAILDQQQLKGGFFWIGQNLKTEQEAEFAKQMIKNGHVIGTHTMNHARLAKKSKEEQIQMIRASTDYISQKIGVPIHYFRPPYGAVDHNTMLASKETNQILTYWNVDSLDWKYGDKPNLIMDNIAREVKPGSIILMHEKEQTVHLLPKVIELLKNRGYDIAPLPTVDAAKKA
ncbi:polysaccharide deacetylase family protein [Aneurinibacillus sp. REN35]|uniref:polysaccharide deacetylase family protein n=1 Tax=Aneurinibacillus sp. REN35 TaxID=3237286 RepID=UPI00352859BD